ncbi:hypothetical protein MASR2M78_31170 [Treponema sp.]
MEILKEITERHAFRAFDSSKLVPRSVLQRCAEAAHLAPSYANKQGWRWVVVDEEPSLSELGKALTGGNYWALKAPALAVLITDAAWSPTANGNRDYATFGSGLSAMNFINQATAEGLIAHPMAGFDPEIAKKALGIPEGHICIVMISIGYKGTDEALNEKHRSLEHAERVRLPMENILAFNRWKNELEPS